MSSGQAHANFFREVMSDPEQAAEILGVFLSPEQREALRLETLRLEDGIFISESLAESQTDLLFRVESASGVERHIQVLFEHKSTLDTRLWLQLLRYQREIYERQASPMPILCVLFYHGERAWSGPIDFHSYLGLSEKERASFMLEVLNFRPVLADTHGIDWDRLRVSLVSYIFLRALHGIRNMNEPEKLGDLLEMARDLFFQPTALKFLERLLYYVYRVHDYGAPEIRAVVEARVGRDQGEIVMTTAERLMKQGREEGLEQGLEKGRLEGRLETARRMLEKGFSPEEIVDLTGLTPEQLRELETPPER